MWERVRVAHLWGNGGQDGREKEWEEEPGRCGFFVDEQAVCFHNFLSLCFETIDFLYFSRCRPRPDFSPINHALHVMGGDLELIAQSSKRRRDIMMACFLHDWRPCSTLRRLLLISDFARCRRNAQSVCRFVDDISSARAKRIKMNAHREHSSAPHTSSARRERRIVSRTVLLRVCVVLPRPPPERFKNKVIAETKKMRKSTRNLFLTRLGFETRMLRISTRFDSNNGASSERKRSSKISRGTESTRKTSRSAWIFRRKCRANSR